MKVDKLICDITKDCTSKEKDEMMLASLEKMYKTGPIIGECRDVILSLLNNLFIRDLYFDAKGVTVEKREAIFREISDYIEEKDQAILHKRKYEKGIEV